MASPAFGAIGTATAFSGGTANVPRPAVSAGDYMVLFVGVDYSHRNSAASGWTLIAQVDPNDVFSSGLDVYGKLAGGSEPSTYTVTISGGSNDGGRAVIATWTGVDGATQIDATNSQTSASSTNSVAGAVTATVADTTLVTAHLVDDQSGSNSYTPPSGMTERFDAYMDGSGTVNRMGIFDEAIAATGSTGTRTAVLTTAKRTRVVSFLLRPTAGGGGGGNAPRAHYYNMMRAA